MGGRSCYSREPNWSCWRGKTAMKTVDGMWFSTLANGLCNSTASWCTWRVLEVAKRVSQSCLNNNLYDAVEGYNRSAFAPCGARNTSSTCWIEAFYDSLLGSEVLTGGPIGGVPLATLDAAWQGSFRGDDPATGGCKPIGPPHVLENPT